MHGEPIEQFPLSRLRRQVANQPAFGRVRPEFFQMLRVVLHDAHLSLAQLYRLRPDHAPIRLNDRQTGRSENAHLY